MNKTLKTIGLLFIGIAIAYYLFANFIPKNEIVGTYVNTNYSYEPFLVEIPYQVDTLILYKDNTFKSNFFEGNGVYEISYAANGTFISLLYNYEFGKARFNSKIERLYSDNLKIILDDEKDHYYAKLSSAGRGLLLCPGLTRSVPQRLSSVSVGFVSYGKVVLLG